MMPPNQIARAGSREDDDGHLVGAGSISLMILRPRFARGWKAMGNVSLRSGTKSGANPAAITAILDAHDLEEFRGCVTDAITEMQLAHDAALEALREALVEFDQPEIGQAIDDLEDNLCEMVERAKQELSL
jgi:hypothetical protein